MKKIVIIEDNIKIRNELSEFLSKYNYQVKAPEVLDDILEYIKEEKPNLILLDINLPVYDGYYICREVRKGSKVPIIIVTSRNSEIDELMSMNLGADDFITKPCNTQILLARISAIFRRVYEEGSINNEIIYNEININIAKGTITHKDKEVELTKNELRIISCLLENKGKIVSRNKLMEYLWTSELFIDDNTLTVNINRLRKKLQELGVKDIIETRRGMGYIIA